MNMNSKYEAIKRFAAEHGDRAELIEHETAIVDLASGAQGFDINQAAATYIVEAKEGVFAVVVSIDPQLVIEHNTIAGYFNGEDFVKPL